MGLFGSIGYKNRLWRSLSDNYGRKPDPFYSAGDMDLIRSYHDYMREHDPDTFRVDDITWSDLDMDRVFKRINPGVSTPGEHWLYYMLRTPAMDAEEYARREKLIHFAEENERERQETQFLLGCLGRIPARSSDMSGDIVTSALLLDLIMFEYLKNKLDGLHDDLLAVFEALGRGSRCSAPLTRCCAAPTP